MNDNLSYKQKFKAIRAHVNFKVDLRTKISRANKSLITRYYNQFIEINQGFKIKHYRTKNINNLRLVQNTFHGVNKTLPKFKTAFIPYTSTYAPRVIISKKKNKKARVILKSPKSNLKQYYIAIDNFEAFIVDTYNYTKSLLNDYSVEDDERLQVMTGDYLSTSDFTAEILPREMEQWLNKYGADNAGFIKGFKSSLYR